MKGLYIHVPFCPKKCPYCDFYSLSYSSELIEKFTDETLRRLKKMDESFDTVYFGGGTPSLLGAKRVEKLLSVISLSSHPEITLESNPNIDFSKWKGSGINRLSLGLQSANESELQFLGRSHSLEQVKKTVITAQDSGISNISLDLMIGIKSMSFESLLSSINFCDSLDVQHISSYMLKIEQGTKFHENRQNLDLPDDDFTAELYLFMVQELEKRGFKQYEISNFCKNSFESRHNLKYWDSLEYKALGPSAHSFCDKKRMFFPRDLDYYLSGNEMILDCIGGDFEEFLMLKLRLSSGITREDFKKFPEQNFDNLLKKTKKIPSQFLNCDGNKIALSTKGFLLSNTIITALISD